ncbi:MAG: zinc ribbon domain-containing protein, partial [Candidatus Enteromonas sp.]|nr:zinc ribbon domain-containing protein [Candidatus Enteromonas sp.]
MNYCPECGAPVEEGAAYCAKCGKHLSAPGTVNPEVVSGGNQEEGALVTIAKVFMILTTVASGF